MIRAAVPRLVHFEFQVEPSVPKVKGDESHIQQALTNLVNNASEAIGTAGGRIRVRVFSVQVDEAMLASMVPGSALSLGPCACVEVQDDGPGLDSETLAKIFDPFFTTKATGRGLASGSCAHIAPGSRWKAHRGAARVSGSISPRWRKLPRRRPFLRARLEALREAPFCSPRTRRSFGI